MSLTTDWRRRMAELAGDLALYRGFAVRLAEYTAAPDAEDMVARHFATCDLDALAEHITERIDTAARLKRLQRLTAWTSLPEIPDQYETVEVKLCDDSRAFAWRDDDGEWRAEGHVGITDADVVGWRSIIP